MEERKVMETIKLYTVHEVASLLTTTPRTIRQYIADKKIKAVKIGRQYHIKEQELNRFILSKEEVAGNLERLKSDIKALDKEPSYKDLQELSLKHKELSLEVILDTIVTLLAE